MSIVIFGMQGTFESQGLPPRRNVKKKEEREREVKRILREDYVCVHMCAKDGELEKDAKM